MYEAYEVVKLNEIVLC